MNDDCKPEMLLRVSLFIVSVLFTVSLIPANGFSHNKIIMLVVAFVVALLLPQLLISISIIELHMRKRLFEKTHPDYNNRMEVLEIIHEKEMKKMHLGWGKYKFYA